MTAKDARDRGILNHLGILRSPPKAAPSFKAPAPINVFKGGSIGFDRLYAYGAQPNHSKPPHAAEAIVGRVRDIGNAGLEDGTKAEWFFDESRASVRQQWASDWKAVRPQVRDQDFLAKKHGERRSIDMFTDMFA
jgi:hypothetical protein